MVNVSQYDINVWVFLVGVALCVYSGVLGRCGVVAFLRLSFFFFLSFFPSFFHFSIFSFFHVFHFFIFSIFSLFFLEIACRGPLFPQSVNEN